MNIICDKTLLSAAIDGVSKAVTLRSTIPVLEGILLKAEGFQLTLTGYDLEMGIVTTIEANVKEPGEIVLNAKLLSSMISRMPAGQITIQSADNGKTTIQSGVAQFEIQSMAATDFPELPNTGAEETLTIPTGVLRDMIDRTLYAVSQDEKKPAHTGELFEIEPDKLTIVALDGYRLAIVERPVTAVKDIRIIVPSKTMTEVAHLLPNDDEELCRLHGCRLHHHEPPDRGRVPQLPQCHPLRQPDTGDFGHKRVHRDHRARLSDYYRAFKKSPPHQFYKW